MEITAGRTGAEPTGVVLARNSICASRSYAARTTADMVAAARLHATALHVEDTAVGGAHQVDVLTAEVVEVTLVVADMPVVVAEATVAEAIAEQVVVSRLAS